MVGSIFHEIASDIVRNISLLDPSKRFVPGETLIIFDEIQELPDVAASLLFFKIDGRFDAICLGLMLGIDYKTIESNSVGYKTDFDMRSLDFEEYLWAKGYGDDVISSMLEHIVTARPFSVTEESAFTSAFLEYCVLGGMPAVVSSFIERGRSRGRSPCSVSWSLIIKRTYASLFRVSSRCVCSTCSSTCRCSLPRKTRSSRSLRWRVAPGSRTTGAASSGWRVRAW